MSAFTPTERRDWEAAKEQEREQLLRQLTDGVAKLSTEENWTAYLRMQSKFHSYSFGNCILLQSQAEQRGVHLSRVAGFGTWKSLGQSIAASQRGFRIFSPMKVDRRSSKDESRDDEEATTHVLFKATSVFDESQLAPGGKPLPEPVKLLQGDDLNGAFARLAKLAAKEGLAVEMAPRRDKANGWYIRAEQRIVVVDDLPGQARARTLSHELGHHFAGHGGHDETERSLRELIAESIAFAVTAELGIKSDDYSFGYLLTWKDGDPKEVEKAIRESGQQIHTAVKQITEGLAQIVAEELHEDALSDDRSRAAVRGSRLGTGLVYER